MSANLVKNYSVYFHDADHNGYISIVSLCNYLQTTADLHSRSLGTSAKYLIEKNFTWVLARMRVLIKDYPKLYDDFSIKTWRSVVNGPYGARENIIRDAKGGELGRATYSITLIDLNKRKPVDIPEYISRQFTPEQGRAFEDEPENLPKADDYVSEKRFSVRAGDIDINGHVNCISYLDWMLESIPEDILLNDKVTEVEMAYKAEAFYGDTIVSKSAPDPQKEKAFLHQLTREKDGAVTTQGRTHFA